MTQLRGKHNASILIGRPLTSEIIESGAKNVNLCNRPAQPAITKTNCQCPLHYPWTKIDGTGLNYSTHTLKRLYLTRACCGRETVIFFVMTLSVWMLELLCWLPIRDISESVRVHKYRVKFSCQTKAQNVRVGEAKVGAATLKDGWVCTWIPFGTASEGLGSYCKTQAWYCFVYMNLQWLLQKVEWILILCGL